MALRDGLLVFTLALGLFGVWNLLAFLLRLRRVFRQVRPTNRFDRLGERVRSVLVHALGHRRMFRDRIAGLLHLFIFSGFLVLFLDIVETIGEPFGFSIGPVLAAVVDSFVLLVLSGIALAVWQRRVKRPARFEGSDEHDAYRILGLITVIMLGIILHDSFFPFVAGPWFHVSDPSAGGHYLGHALSRVWQRLGWDRGAAAVIGYTLGYAMDIGTVLGFLSYLPRSKHLHILLAVPNIFFRRLSPESGSLWAPEGTPPIRTFADLHWKDVLDLFTCTECGRCQDVCPAWQNRRVLSPKMLILELRDALRQEMASGRALATTGPLPGGVVSPEELWDCTTCGACQEACPVFIEHVPKIVGMRAALVEEGRLAGNAQDALESWLAYGNSFQKPRRQRGHWTEALDFPIPDARREPVDVLWFVGDFASFDPGVARSTRLTAEILHRADVHFGLLYEGESNSGNDALAMGEFGLFELLRRDNLAAVQDLHYQRIMTTDPHSLRALRQEYRRGGLKGPVLHYSQLFLELVEGGILRPKPLGRVATYHDPCYLARWSEITDVPRRLLHHLGIELREMEHHGRNTFCCGAGGGKIFIDGGGTGDRPAERRMREAVAVGVETFVVACPKDVVMFTAAAASLGLEGRMHVVDLAELLAEALGMETGVTLALMNR